MAGFGWPRMTDISITVPVDLREGEEVRFAVGPGFLRIDIPTGDRPMTEQDATRIVTEIDTSTVAGHNLRAALLIAADDDYPWSQCPDVDGLLERCISLGLMFDLGGLTALGFSVAVLLRPEQWRVTMHNDGRFGVALGKGSAAIRCEFKQDAERIVALFNADSLRSAKSYRIDPV